MAGRIVAGLDGSEGSRLALAWAVEEAVAHGAIVEAVTVCRGAVKGVAERHAPYITTHPMNLPAHAEADDARRRLTEAVAQVAATRPDITIRARVLQGEDAADTLCREAEEADVLVVGARGRSTVRTLLLGSVASTCAVRSPCPVVIVPAGSPPEVRHGPARTGRIVVGVDMSDASRHALEWAIEEAEARDCAVRVVTVSATKSAHESDGHGLVGQAAETGARRDLEALVAGASGAAPVEIESLVLEGDPSERLCQQARDADMLVVGDRGHGSLGSLLLGSVASRCAHHSARPVAIVRPQWRRRHELAVEQRPARVPVGCSAGVASSVPSGGQRTTPV